MPRTIEHLAETHRLAAERRAAGKPVWDRHLNIKQFIDQEPDNLSEEHAAKVANQIGTHLRSRLPAALLDWESDQHDATITEIVEELEAMRPGDYADDPSFSVLADLNGRLDELYDWADINRVWLG